MAGAEVGSPGSGRAPPRPALLWAIGLAGFAGAGCTYAVAFTSNHLTEPGVQASLLNWITLSYVFSGLVAWLRRPAGRFGPMMITAGFVTFLTTLYWSNDPALSTVALALDYLPPVLFLHVFLAFPTGRLLRWPERALVGVAYVASVGLSLVRMLLGAFGPRSLISVVDEPILDDELERVQLVVVALLALAGIAALVARRVGEGWHQRRSRALLVDFFAIALAMIAVLFLCGAFFSSVAWWGFEPLRRATFVVVGAAPVAFLIGLLQARLARTNVGDLLVELREDPQLGDLRDSLARALRDPTLVVAYWLPQFQSWADGHGQPIELPEPGGTRATTLIDRNGVAVAALVHDPLLRDETELIEAVSAAAGIALENGRLHAELRARVEELAGSRARVIDAEQKERQRLERDLHDGAQQRLVSLSLELGLLEEELAADPAAMTRLDRARRTVALSLEELRDLARGIHPAVVSAHGLAVALEELTAHAPVRVGLSIELEDRLPEQLEVAAYYLVCEGLANIAKHASATTAAVSVSRANGSLIVEVTDDGVGGADTEQGTGLRGLADRVEALGGRLQVWSPTGEGTRVRGELPCVS
jgi:signal transduction histidine kinase